VKLETFTKPQKLAAEQHRLVRALVVLKTRNPEIYNQLELALHEALDAEMVAPVRVPPAMLPTAQGRAQVAQDVLAIVDNIEHYRLELEKAEHAARAAAAKTQPPPGQGQ
jgi:hypothetical protein